MKNSRLNVLTVPMLPASGQALKSAPSPFFFHSFYHSSAGLQYDLHGNDAFGISVAKTVFMNDQSYALLTIQLPK